MISSVLENIISSEFEQNVGKGQVQKSGVIKEKYAMEIVIAISPIMIMARMVIEICIFDFMRLVIMLRFL